MYLATCTAIILSAKNFSLMCYYSTNHPQLKWYMCHTHVCRICKSKEHAWHQTTHVHVCKISVSHMYTHMPLSIQSICHEMIPSSSALSFIICTCRNIFGGIVIDIPGHPRHTAFVAS